MNCDCKDILKIKVKVIVNKFIAGSVYFNVEKYGNYYKFSSPQEQFRSHVEGSFLCHYTFCNQIHVT